MTAELAIEYLGHLRRKQIRDSAPKDALPRAHYRDKSHQRVEQGIVEWHTLAVDPE